MIEAYDRCFDAEIESFIRTLASLFGITGLTRRGEELFCRCPFHSNGQERTASASFKLSGEHPGEFYCFGCKTSGYLSSILTKLFGSKRKAIHWLESNYKELEKELVRKVNKVSLESLSDTQNFDIPLSLLDNYTPYFEQRGIPQELVKKFRLGYSKVRNAVFLPVFDENDRLVFYQVRYLDKEAPMKWYIPKGAKPEIFGEKYLTDKSVVVCESVFNALTCWKFGKQSVCLFGARSDNNIKQKLLNLPCLKFIIGFDYDDAGIKNARELARFLKQNGRLVEVLAVDEPDKKDINDFANLTQEDFEKKWQEWKMKGEHLIKLTGIYTKSRS